MVGEIKNTMRKSAGKLYMIIFLCGSKAKLEKEIMERTIQDENDILKEEFDRQLDAIRGLWNPDPNIGRLVLNKVNIEKSGLLLDTERYLENMHVKPKPDQFELKEIARKKRIHETNMMFDDLGSSVDRFNDNDSNSDYNSPDTKRMDPKEQQQKFQKTIDKFLELNTSQGMLI
jgi:hypothetical protein